MITTGPDAVRRRIRAAFAAFVRLGYAARGTLYLVIGWLAGLTAADAGGRTTDGAGALLTLLGSPAGRAATGAVALGLVGYAGWRAAQALLDTDRHGDGPGGLAIRAAMLVSAVAHGGLAVVGWRLAVLGAVTGGTDGGKRAALDWVMHLPAGPYWIGALALLVAGAGAAQVFKGANLRYRPYLRVGDGGMRVLAPLCSFGLIARGAVFALVGMLLGLAAVEVDPNQPVGLDHALAWLHDQRYGDAILGVVAAGLLAFGLYSLVEAMWRRIDLPD